MPSSFDTTYHNIFRKPTFDDEGDKKMWQIRKEADEVFEMRPAPVPTQAQENEYMDFLQEDLKSDPWATYRFRKYTANPKRIPWKNTRQLKRQYQFTFTTNWVIGSILSWPVAAMIGRSFKKNAGGVPMVRLNRWIHDFPNPEPGRSSRLLFRYYSIGSAIAFGFAFAYYITDNNQKTQNQWYARPDLKPFAAMVDTPKDLTRETMLESQYVTKREGEGKRSPLFRFFLARDADFTVKENPYQKMHPDDVWDPRKGHYSTYSSDFPSHVQ